MKRALSLVLCLCLVFTLASPAAFAEEEAETILGLKESNVYLSEFLGITAVFDEDWVLLSDEEAQEAMGHVAESFEDEDLAKLLRESGTVCDLFAVALDGSNDTVSIQLEDLGLLYGMVLSEAAYAKRMLEPLKNSLEQMGLEKVEIGQESIDFAGEEHLGVIISGEMNGAELYERLVLLKAGSYMATVTYASVGSHNADRLPELFFALDTEADEAA